MGQGGSRAAQRALQVRKRPGHAADTLVRIAHDERFDLLVLGRRGHSAIARWLIGSTSERVLRHASCPVLIAP